MQLDMLSAVKDVRTLGSGKKIRVLRERDSVSSVRSLSVSEVDGSAQIQTAAFTAAFTLHPSVSLPRLGVKAGVSLVPNEVRDSYAHRPPDTCAQVGGILVMSMCMVYGVQCMMYGVYGVYVQQRLIVVSSVCLVLCLRLCVYACMCLLVSFLDYS